MKCLWIKGPGELIEKKCQIIKIDEKWTLVSDDRFHRKKNNGKSVRPFLQFATPKFNQIQVLIKNHFQIQKKSRQAAIRSRCIISIFKVNLSVDNRIEIGIQFFFDDITFFFSNGSIKVWNVVMNGSSKPSDWDYRVVPVSKKLGVVCVESKPVPSSTLDALMPLNFSSKSLTTSSLETNLVPETLASDFGSVIEKFS